ncbi:MAG TPA: thioredoxin domain-containing protein [Chitinophagaceae bacterium]|nr:thioredoxin domain-containing protein [Chitinophagaceae bacterium]
MSNRLERETSPYLLQHAHNPVDWFPWGNEALQRAKKENKPILISIGYSACHWCHVMEKESFENEEIAAIMNENFINIKIDREERPDLDQIYMDAVQTMTGSGGWPLNVFLTPDKKPFFGGTYFPPRRAFNRSSWREVLIAVSSAFKGKRDEIDTQAENLTAHLLQSNSFGQQSPGVETDFSREKLDELFQNVMRSADKDWGGFGRAPKFPQTFSIQFLLRYHHVTKNIEALNQACLSLDKMIEGGIYDQLGGGFARYSTDNEWLVPHFEKMLYDNALLVSVLAEAYQLTKKDRYGQVIDETIEFVKREMMHPDGGFYSALDADSESEEGKFYTWELDEVRSLLGSNSEIFSEFFDVTEKGNWEGKNILRNKKSLEDFAREKNISIDELRSQVQNGKSFLLSERNKRIRPALDDKIILSWNSLMNIALSKAFAATGRDDYRDLSIANIKFLMSHFRDKSGDYFHHSWKNNEAKNFAFLDDYAFLILALLNLQEVTGEVHWLFTAKEITEYVLKNFGEDETDFFLFTDARQQDVIFRKKEVYDGATPSGNATMANNIYRLSVLLNIPEWKERAGKMISSLSKIVVQYPTSFGVWAMLMMELVDGLKEIVVVGGEPSTLAAQVLAEYIPHKIFLVSKTGKEQLPLLTGKTPIDKTLIYLCREYSCLKPVTEVNQLLALINEGNKN